ncbi:LuxR C-terminal-related transcriptional regulator [Thiomicrorhabdus indica]|uniref:LuxR C-terminal-related transcriptional regulator n=1 Tax=Thiomicrorhabdus indica TaxID=2267253 RepID=UPI002AA93F26|nr:LuxR C-terminal-related transcriptional regulator [Thiomicrorhabdus indica]
MQNSLIYTKLFYPETKELVQRSQLSKRLIDGLTRTLTLVSAPAGFGKTSFVASALKDQDSAVHWISLDDTDHDFFTFWKIVLVSLQQKTPKFGKASITLLESHPTPNQQQFLSTLLNDLLTLSHPFIIVLDDYHSLDSLEIDEGISFLIEHCPENLRLIVITREDPSFPLGLLRAKNHLSEFRGEDLRFTQEESYALFNELGSLKLNNQQLKALHQRSEGWVVGMQLASISLQRINDPQTFIDEFSGSHRFIVDYLVEEVIQQLPENHRKFITQIATLPKFSAELCNVILNIHDSQEIINSLEKQNLFLIPLDFEKRWFRFHHLFSDTLKAFSSNKPDDNELIHISASDWFLKRELFIEAVEHSELSKNAQHIVSILETAWPRLREYTPETQFLTWVKHIPEEVLASSQMLSTHYAISLLSNDFEKATKWLNIAEKLCTLPELLGLIYIGKAYASGANGNAEEVINYCTEAQKVLSDTEYVWRASTSILKGMTLWQLGNLNNAEIELIEGHRLMKKSKEISSITSTAYVLANFYISRGKRLKAKKLCLNALEDIQNLNFIPQGLSDLYVTLASLAFGQYEIETAISWLDKAEEAGEAGKLLETAHHWYILKALIASTNGLYDDAQDLLEEAHANYTPSPAPELAPIPAWEARNAIKSKDMLFADHWYQNIKEIPTQTLTIFEQLTIVRLNFFKFKEGKNLQLLEGSNEIIERLLKTDHTEGVHIELYLLLSLQYLYQEECKIAKKFVLKALALPEVDQYRFYFIDILSDHSKWLISQIRGIPNHVWLLNLFDNSLSEPPKEISNASHILIEPLSDRETEVLQKLKSELSGPQIAESLFVSLNTLRTHTKNIYSKLSVNNRRAAVRKAQELNL